MADVLSAPVVILGSGPAGLTAAVYAARAGLGPVLLHGIQPGGQLSATTDVENFPGFASAVQGPWLMAQMTAQAVAVGTRVIADTIVRVDLGRRPLVLRGDSGAVYHADSLVIATGASARWLGLPSERRFLGFGVSACATCDGFFFRDQRVAVVGGGDTAAEEALYLSGLAASVVLVHRRRKMRASVAMQKRLFARTNITFLWETEVEEIRENPDSPRNVGSLLLRSSTRPGEKQEIPVDGLFVAIGHTPNTRFLAGQLAMDGDGYITTRPDQSTSVPGVFACGDVQDRLYRQAVVAAGTGCIAALGCERFLRDRELSPSLPVPGPPAAASGEARRGCTT